MNTNSNHNDINSVSVVSDSATVDADKAPFSATLGTLMKSWRTSSNRSVYSVAKSTGLSAHTINRIESGRTVNLEAALRYLAFSIRADPKNRILRDYLAAVKDIEITPRQPRGCLVTEVSKEIVSESNTLSSNQDAGWLDEIRNRIAKIFIS